MHSSENSWNNIPTIGPQTEYSKIGGPIVGIYKSLTNMYMNSEIGNKAVQFNFWVYLCFEVAVQCNCRNWITGFHPQKAGGILR
jgi:hypothetical protein